MGFQSQAGHVLFRTQSAKGSFADPASLGIGMRVRNGSIGGKRDLMIPDPETGGNRDIPDALLGPISFAGDYEFYARLESLATLLYWALGDVDSTPDDPEVGANTHVITPIDGASALPWGSIEEKIGDGLDGFRYTDARVNTLHLEADSKGYVMGTVGIIALTQVAIGPSTTPSPDFDTSELLVGSNTTLSFDDTNLKARSFKFDLNNNMEEDDFRLGSLFLGDAVAKRRDVTFGCQVRPESRDMWRQAMYGDAAATQAGGTVVKSNVLLTIESYAVIGATTTVESLTIAVPKAAIKPFEQKPSGDDVIQYDVEIQCLRPDPDDDILTATIVNGLAAVV